jgi:hypothetical protein
VKPLRSLKTEIRSTNNADAISGLVFFPYTNLEKRSKEKKEHSYILLRVEGAGM